MPGLAVELALPERREVEALVEEVAHVAGDEHELVEGEQVAVELPPDEDAVVEHAHVVPDDRVVGDGRREGADVGLLVVHVEAAGHAHVEEGRERPRLDAAHLLEDLVVVLEAGVARVLEVARHRVVARVVVAEVRVRAEVVAEDVVVQRRRHPLLRAHLERLLPQLQQVLLDGLRAEPRHEHGAEQRGAGSRDHRTMP